MRESTLRGAGKGVFARVPLALGESLEVIGALVEADSTSDECTHYADQHKFRVGSYLLIPLGFGGIVNHSSTPNMERIVIGHRTYLRALRPIPADEELFWNYGLYAQRRFGL